MKNKSKEELTRELQEQQTEKFLKEFEAATEPIIEKYQMRLIPRVLNLSNEVKVHYEAAFAVQRFTKEEIKVTPNEKLDTKPETNERTDTDDKVSKG